MTGSVAWQQSNHAYLALALAWLRLRLECQAERRRADGTDTAPSAAAARERQLADAAAAMAAAEEADPEPALVRLARRLGLSRFEQEVLLLCAAAELDPRLGSLCARVQDDSARPYPTFALALAVFDDPAEDALSPARPLRHWRLIEVDQSGNQPLAAAALRADERIVNHLRGLDDLDPRLAPLLTPLESRLDVELPPSQRGVAEEIARRWGSSVPGQRMPAIQLTGPDAGTKLHVAAHAADVAGLRLYRLDSALLAPASVELDIFVRLVQRELALRPLAVYLDALAAPDGDQGAPFVRFAAGCEGALVLDTLDVRTDLGGDTVALEVGKPTAAEQSVAWETALGEFAGSSPARLAGQFSLGLLSVHEIGGAARAVPFADHVELDARLWDACLRHARRRLEPTAERLDPRASWDDIALPPAELGLLRRLAAQVGAGYRVDQDSSRAREREGAGITALFTGERGAGKALVAEALANELRLDLYRIDLGAAASRYIGETEKKLRRLFDAAADGGAVLLFDEADALFGERTEVEDSHDRFANIGVGYLLQRVESFPGLAIFATTRKNALDAAFARRMRLVIEFRPAGDHERRAIWENAFPSGIRLEGLDFDRLSRFGLDRGSIRLAAVNAADLAERDDSAVTMPQVLAAVRRELRRLDRPIDEDDFR